MTCACVENTDGTAILQACRLHDAWAKATYRVKITHEKPAPFVIEGEPDETHG
jgi:hypothetical protein